MPRNLSDIFAFFSPSDKSSGDPLIHFPIAIAIIHENWSLFEHVVEFFTSAAKTFSVMENSYIMKIIGTTQIAQRPAVLME